MSIYDSLPETRGIQNPIWMGRFAKNVVTLNELASVVIPDIDPDFRHDGCYWAPAGDSTPEKDDVCLIAFDNNNRPWVVNWWPKDGIAMGGGGASVPGIQNGEVPVWDTTTTPAKWVRSTSGKLIKVSAQGLQLGDTVISRPVTSHILFQDPDSTGRILFQMEAGWPYISIFPPPLSGIGGGAGISFQGDSPTSPHTWDIYTEVDAPARPGLHFFSGEINQDVARLYNTYFLLNSPVALQFGNVNGSGDTTLQRRVAGELFSPDSAITLRRAFWSERADADPLTAAVFGALKASDLYNRFVILLDGHMWWSDGIHAPDVDLYRQSSQLLRTTGGFGVSNDGQYWVYLDAWGGMIEIRADPGPSGGLKFGPPGSAGVPPLDTFLYRNGANGLKTDTPFTSKLLGVATPAASAYALTVWVGAESQDRFELMADGKMLWGPGGSTPLDVSLYRRDSNGLETDKAFSAWGAMVVGRTVGADNSPLYFGSALDTKLWRDAADTLKTDDTLDVAALKIAGVPFTPSGGGGATVATTIAGLGTASDGRIGRLRLGSSPYEFLQVIYDAAKAKWISPDFSAYGVQFGGGEQNATIQAFQDNGNVIVALIPLWSAYQAAGLTLEMRAAFWISSNQSNANGGWKIAYQLQAAGNVGHPANGASATVLASSTTASTTEAYVDTGWVAFSPASNDHLFLFLLGRANNTGQQTNIYNSILKWRFLG